VLVHSYKRFNSEAWFDNQVQKMVSVAAGIASSHFTANSWKIWHAKDGLALEGIRPAVFDARAFIVPEADVCNYFLWRQQDATRNSIQMLARSLYSHKECDNKNTSQLQEMCSQKGTNWDALPTRWKRGACVKRVESEPHVMGHVKERTIIDLEIPVFSQDRDYVNRLLAVEET